jgi:hypothetical protein
MTVPNPSEIARAEEPRPGMTDEQLEKIRMRAARCQKYRRGIVPGETILGDILDDLDAVLTEVDRLREAVRKGHGRFNELCDRIASALGQ